MRARSRPLSLVGLSPLGSKLRDRCTKLILATVATREAFPVGRLRAAVLSTPCSAAVLATQPPTCLAEWRRGRRIDQLDFHRVGVAARPTLQVVTPASTHPAPTHSIRLGARISSVFVASCCLRRSRLPLAHSALARPGGASFEI